jgi:hypothetical protein
MVYVSVKPDEPVFSMLLIPTPSNSPDSFAASSAAKMVFRGAGSFHVCTFNGRNGRSGNLNIP